MTELNAFATTFLEIIHKRHFPQYPLTLESGRWNGPWDVKESDQGEKWHVVRDGCSDVEAILEFRETACMLAAVYPLSFQAAVYGMEHEDSDDLSWALKTQMGDRGYSTIGHIKYGHDDLVIPLNIAHRLLTSPTSLAWLLAAAPPEVLAQAGELMIKRMVCDE